MIRTIEKSATPPPRDPGRSVLDATVTGAAENRQDDTVLRCVSGAAPWTLGAIEIDTRLGATGLDPHAVHEIKPGHTAGDWAAAAGFVMRLAVRRLHAEGASRATRILWGTTSRMCRELGRPHGAGLLRMGLDPGALILVEASQSADLLWAMEEGLKSRSLMLAICITDTIAPVPARRLSLAAGTGATPVLLLTHPARAPATATATRWRISTQPAAPHPLDPRAPGATRFGVALERCRARPLAIENWSHVVEWSDETLCFRLAAGLADRAQPQPHGHDAEAEPGRSATG